MHWIMKSKQYLFSNGLFVREQHNRLFHFQECNFHGLDKLCDILQIVFSSEIGAQAPLLDAVFRNLLNQRIESHMGVEALTKMVSQCFTNILNGCFIGRAKQFFLEDFKYVQSYQGLHFIRCILPILRIHSELCSVALSCLKKVSAFSISSLFLRTAKCLAFNQPCVRLLALDGLLLLANITERNRGNVYSTSGCIMALNEIE